MAGMDALGAFLAQLHDMSCTNDECAMVRERLQEAEREVGSLWLKLQQALAKRPTLVSAATQTEPSASANRRKMQPVPALCNSAMPHVSTRSRAGTLAFEFVDVNHLLEEQEAGHVPPSLVKPGPSPHCANTEGGDAGGRSPAATGPGTIPARSVPDDQQPTEQLDTEDVHIGPRCWQCSAMFQSYKQMEEHTTAKHPGTNAHCCIHCSRTFTSFSSLTQHTRSAHQAQGTQAKEGSQVADGYTCSVCSLKFTSYWTFSLHSAVHSTKRPFKCGACKKSYAHPFLLSTHERIHSGKNAKSCPDCKRRFKKLVGLKLHLSKGHCPKSVAVAAPAPLPQRGPRDVRHVCIVCGRRFVIEGAFRNHMLFSLCSGTAAALAEGAGRSANSSTVALPPEAVGEGAAPAAQPIQLANGMH